VSSRSIWFFTGTRWSTSPAGILAL
jgi:hypothetical protein